MSLYTWEDFVAALRQVETGGLPNGGEYAIGDGGDSIGPLQIQWACWRDAMDRTAAAEQFPYADCNKIGPSVFVLRKYLERYAVVALRVGDWQTCARIWNGGPRGNRKAATLPYWAKMERELEKARKRRMEGNGDTGNGNSGNPAVDGPRVPNSEPDDPEGMTAPPWWLRLLLWFFK